jgi:hypothetical protein
MTLLPLPTSPPSSRREQLRDALRVTVDMLNRGRVDLIAPGFLADYLALDWLEDRGTGLRLTSRGTALCLEIALRTK